MAFATRYPSWPAPTDIAQLRSLKGLVNGFMICRGEFKTGMTAERDVVVKTEVSKQVMFLEHHGYRPLCRRQSANILIVHKDRTAERFKMSLVSFCIYELIPTAEVIVNSRY